MKRLLFTSIIFLSCVNGVYAAGNEPAANPSPSASKTQKLQPIVITPSRHEEMEADVGKSVTVIDEDRIKKSGARTIPELLKGEVGIDVRNYLGNAKSAQVDIRGFGETAGSNTLVLIDGRRVNQIDQSGVDWAQVNVDSIKSIEIVRGSQTVLYGDNAVGGVINIITKDGEGKKPEVGYGLKFGTFDYAAYNIFAQGGHKFLDYYFDFTQSSTDGYRTNNAVETIDYTGSVTVRPADGLKLKFNGGYHRDWYGMPGALRQTDLERLGPGGSTFPNDRSKTEDGYIMFGTDISHDGNFGDVVLSNDLIARSRRTATISYWTGGNTEFNNHIKTLGITPKITVISEILKMMNRVIVGTDIYLDRDEILSGQGPKDLVNIDKKSCGVYATDMLALTPALSVNGGARMEWVKYTFDQQTVLTGRSKKSPSEYSCDAGLNYKYNDTSSMYTNYSRSVRFPAVDDWYSSMYPSWGGIIGGGLNLDLEPQIGNTYEVGIKDNTLKQLSMRASFYIIDLKHEIFYNPVTWANSIYDRTMRQGVEVETHVYPIESLDTFLKYTYEKAFFVGGSFNGNEIPMVPRYKISGGVSYTLMDCFNVTYALNFVGSRRFISDQNAIAAKLGSYITQDVKISYNKYGLEILAALNNIADERYSEYGVTNAAGRILSYYPSPGRNFVFGVKQKF